MPEEMEDLTAYNSWLKELFIDGTKEQFRRMSIFFDSGIITQNMKDVEGTNAIVAVEGISMAGVASAAERGTLPTPRPGRYRRLTIPMTYAYMSLGLTGQVIKASRSNRGAFERAMVAESRTKMNAWFMDRNREMLWDGNAILALVDGTPTTTAITVDAAGGVADDINGHLFITEDCDLDFYAADGTYRGSATVTAVTEGSGTSTSAIITVDALPTDVTDNDQIFRKGARGNEATGLLGMASTTSTLYGLAPSAFRDWTCTRVTGATAGTTESLTKLRMERLKNTMRHRAGVDPKIVLCSPDVALTYGDLASRGNIMVNRMKIGTTDWEGIDWGGRAIVDDLFCPKNRMFYIAPEIFGVHQMGSPGWLPLAGGDVLYRIQGEDNYRADWAWYWLPAIYFRRGLGVLEDILTLA